MGVALNKTVHKSYERGLLGNVPKIIETSVNENDIFWLES